MLELGQALLVKLVVTVSHQAHLKPLRP